MCRRRAAKSYASVTIRVRDWYDSLLQDTVTVSHGETMRALLVALDVHTPISAVDMMVEQGVVYVFRRRRSDET